MDTKAVSKATGRELMEAGLRASAGERPSAVVLTYKR
jgi:hypothetical protein